MRAIRSSEKTYPQKAPGPHLAEPYTAQYAISVPVTAMVAAAIIVNGAPTMRGHAMPGHTWPCHALSCHAMRGHARPCAAMPCHAMPCHAGMSGRPHWGAPTRCMPGDHRPARWRMDGCTRVARGSTGPPGHPSFGMTEKAPMGNADLCRSG